MNSFFKSDSLNVLVICRKEKKKKLSVITVLSLLPLSNTETWDYANEEYRLEFF